MASRISEQEFITNLGNNTQSIQTMSQEEESRKLNLLVSLIANLNAEEIGNYLESEKVSILILNSCLLKVIESSKCPDKYEIVNLLLTNGASPNALIPDLKIPLLLKAASSGDIQLITMLLDHKAKTDILDSKGQNALFYVLMSRKGDNADVISTFIACGCDVNLSNKDDETPLLIACKENLKNCAKILLDHGANVNSLDRLGKNNSCLHYAAENGNLELVKLLVSKNINFKAVNSENNTACAIALKNQKLNIYSFLLEENSKKQVIEKKNCDELCKDNLKTKKDSIKANAGLGLSIIGYNNINTNSSACQAKRELQIKSSINQNKDKVSSTAKEESSTGNLTSSTNVSNTTSRIVLPKKAKYASLSGQTSSAINAVTKKSYQPNISTPKSSSAQSDLKSSKEGFNSKELFTKLVSNFSIQNNLSGAKERRSASVSTAGSQNECEKLIYILKKAKPHALDLNLETANKDFKNLSNQISEYVWLKYNI